MDERIRSAIESQLRQVDWTALDPIIELCSTSPELERSRFAALAKEISQFLTPESEWNLVKREFDRLEKTFSAYVIGSEVRESHMLAGEPTFELVASDKAKVLELCERMRVHIYGIPELDDSWRNRLLARVHAIELELNRPKGRLDVVLGGMIEVSEAAKKVGQNLQPVTDFMKEVNNLVWGRSETHKQLPPPDDTKALPPPDGGQ